MSKGKETYRQFCETSTRPLIFQTPAWLDAVAGCENWDVALAFNGNLLSGAMPFVTNSKLGLKQITLPFLTPYLGPIIIFPSDLKKENYLSHKRKVITELVKAIPTTDRFITQTDFEFDYWSPFSWEGYKQTTRYSYVLGTDKTEETLFNGLKPNIRKHIKKASSFYEISNSSSVNELYELHESDLNAKNIKILFSKDQLTHLDKALAAEQKRTILIATDTNNVVVCAFYLVFDHQYTHYLLGAVSESHRNSGVMSLLMWEAIKISQSKGLTFNFEGSMNKNIERFFTSFGPELTPYMQLTKVSNKWLKQFTKFNH